MRLIDVALLAATIVPSAAMAEDDRSRMVSCKLVVEGEEFIGGPCRFTPLGRDGSFQIMSGNGQYFAQVHVERPGKALGYWNGEPYANHAHNNLGQIIRQNACWVNDVASICAW